MNPATILSTVLTVITQLPSVAASVEALVAAISAMGKSGHDPAVIMKTVAESAGSIATAVVANTPHDTPVNPVT